MTTHGQVAERFATRGRPLRGHNVYADAKHIYSYGSHFPMAYADDERRLFIVNGDTFSSSTSGHQSHVRGAIERTSWEHFIIPFSVLRSANVEMETLELIEQGKEISEGICRTCKISWDFHDRNGWEGYDTHLSEFGYNKPNYVVYQCEEHKNTLGNTHIDGSYNYGYKHYHRNPNYRPNPHDMTTRHLLAPSLLKGYQRTVLDIPDSPCAWCTKPKDEHPAKTEWGSTCNYRPQTLEKRTAAYFLSGFDETGRGFGGGYFFSHLPRKASTIEEAFALLRPKPVQEADQAGIEVKRQGDIFAIPVEVQTRKLTKRGSRVKFGQLLKTNHFATEIIVTKTETYARGFLHHRPGLREADHRPIKLGKMWHRIFRNTAKGSWSAARGTGRVD